MDDPRRRAGDHRAAAERHSPAELDTVALIDAKSGRQTTYREMVARVLAALQPPARLLVLPKLPAFLAEHPDAVRGG